MLGPFNLELVREFLIFTLEWISKHLQLLNGFHNKSHWIEITENQMGKKSLTNFGGV